MFKLGWVNEVDYLLSLQKEKGLKMPALDSIGYKQVIEYINNGIDKETLIETVVNKTRQYARSQDKWFKKERIDLFVDLTNLEGFDVHKYICDIYSII
jgi:tRNA dimethylallyltransferase